MQKLLEGHKLAVKDVEVADIVATVLVGDATASSIVIVAVTGPAAIGYFILFCWI